MSSLIGVPATDACPVCGKQIDTFDLERHVNMCLDAGGDLSDHFDNLGGGVNTMEYSIPMSTHTGVLDASTIAHDTDIDPLGSTQHQGDHLDGGLRRRRRPNPTNHDTNDNVSSAHDDDDDDDGAAGGGGGGADEGDRAPPTFQAKGKEPVSSSPPTARHLVRHRGRDDGRHASRTKRRLKDRNVRHAANDRRAKRRDVHHRTNDISSDTMDHFVGFHVPPTTTTRGRDVVDVISSSSPPPSSSSSHIVSNSPFEVDSSSSSSTPSMGHLLDCIQEQKLTIHDLERKILHMTKEMNTLKAELRKYSSSSCLEDDDDGDDDDDDGKSPAVPEQEERVEASRHHSAHAPSAEMGIALESLQKLSIAVSNESGTDESGVSCDGPASAPPPRPSSVRLKLSHHNVLRATLNPPLEEEDALLLFSDAYIEGYKAMVQRRKEAHLKASETYSNAHFMRTSADANAGERGTVLGHPNPNHWSDSDTDFYADADQLRFCIKCRAQRRDTKMLDCNQHYVCNFCSRGDFLLYCPVCEMPGQCVTVSEGHWEDAAFSSPAPPSDSPVEDGWDDGDGDQYTNIPLQPMDLSDAHEESDEMEQMDRDHHHPPQPQKQADAMEEGRAITITNKEHVGEAPVVPGIHQVEAGEQHEEEEAKCEVDPPHSSDGPPTPGTRRKQELADQELARRLQDTLDLEDLPPLVPTPSAATAHGYHHIPYQLRERPEKTRALAYASTPAYGESAALRHEGLISAEAVDAYCSPLDKGVGVAHGERGDAATMAGSDAATSAHEQVDGGGDAPPMPDDKEEDECDAPLSEEEVERRRLQEEKDAAFARELSRQFQSEDLHHHQREYDAMPGYEDMNLVNSDDDDDDEGDDEGEKFARVVEDERFVSASSSSSSSRGGEPLHHQHETKSYEDPVVDDATMPLLDHWKCAASMEPGEQCTLGTFRSLNVELLRHTFTYLPRETLGVVASCCRPLLQLSEEACQWKAFAEQLAKEQHSIVQAYYAPYDTKKHEERHDGVPPMMMDGVKKYPDVSWKGNALRLLQASPKLQEGRIESMHGYAKEIWRWNGTHMWLETSSLLVGMSSRVRYAYAHGNPVIIRDGPTRWYGGGSLCWDERTGSLSYGGRKWMVTPRGIRAMAGLRDSWTIEMKHIEADGAITPWGGEPHVCLEARSSGVGMRYRIWGMVPLPLVAVVLLNLTQRLS